MPDPITSDEAYAATIITLSEYSEPAYAIAATEMEEFESIKAFFQRVAYWRVTDHTPAVLYTEAEENLIRWEARAEEYGILEEVYEYPAIENGVI